MSSRRRVPALALLAFGLAGCLSAGDDGPPAGGTATPTPDGGDPSGTPVDASQTSVSAPTWSAGQAWTWELRSGALEQAVRATTVVLAAEAGGYDLGAASPEDGAALLPFHIAALGAVDASCLCWQAHGTPVSLLRFPLEGPDRFVADFWSASGATVTVEPATVAGPDGAEPGYRTNVTYADGGALFLTADYAPARGQFVRVASHFGQLEPFAEVVLVGNATADAPVAFRAVDLARYLASAADPPSLAPRPLTVPADAELALLSCFLPPEQGAYVAQLSSAGTAIACGGAKAEGRRYSGALTTAEPGPATVTAQAGGQGALAVEVFAVDTTVA